MKKVLIITYRFYPQPPEFASRNAVGLAKHLAEFGWNPLILTTIFPREPDERYQIVDTPYRDCLSFFKKVLGLKSDQRLLMHVAEIKSKFKVTTETSILDYLLKLSGAVFAYPDPQIGWKKPAVQTASDLLAANDVDAVISLAPPVTTHLIASELKKRHDIPWIAYFRDLWTQNHYYPYGALRCTVERKLELKTIAYADSLIVVSEPDAEKLGRLHPNVPINVISGGFNPESFEDDPARVAAKFTIAYTGNVYPRKQSPKILFEAIAELIAKNELDPTDIEVNFFGPKLGWIQKLIAHYNLEEIVKQYGIIPWEVSLAKQRESQILLLLDWMDSSDLGVYTGKVFEYLGARRPILAIGGSYHNVIHKLLNKTRAGVHCTTVIETKNYLKQAYQEYIMHKQVGYRGEESEIMKYSHRQMAKKLAEILNLM